jgi:hypothetical protein
MSPQIGNMCPDTEELHPFSTGFCLNGCQKQCLPPAVLNYIEQSIKGDKHTGAYISATALTGCMRQLYGSRMIDYYVKPPHNWWSIRGRLFHLIMEDSGQTIEDWLPEQEYECFLGHYHDQDWYLRGTLDVLRPKQGILGDFKSSGDRGMWGLKYGLKEDHVIQFNIYKYLCEKGWPVGQRETYQPILINKIIAWYFSMMQVIQTGNIFDEVTQWVANEPEKTPTEVKRELVGEKTDLVLKRGKRHATAKPEDYSLKTRQKWRIYYKVDPVPIWDNETIEKIIQERSMFLIDAFAKGTPPPMCDIKSRSWKCDYCADPIVKWCDEINAKEGVQRLVVEEEL